MQTVQLLLIIKISNIVKWIECMQLLCMLIIIGQISHQTPNFWTKSCSHSMKFKNWPTLTCRIKRSDWWICVCVHFQSITFTAPKVILCDLFTGTHYDMRRKIGERCGPATFFFSLSLCRKRTSNLCKFLQRKLSLPLSLAACSLLKAKCHPTCQNSNPRDPFTVVLYLSFCLFRLSTSSPLQTFPFPFVSSLS